MRLGQLGDTVAAIVAYGDVVERFGDCDEPSIQMVVARALVNKGYWKGQLGKAEAAIAAYDEVVSPTSPTQRELCRFSLFSTTQVIELLNLCTAQFTPILPVVPTYPIDLAFV